MQSNVSLSPENQRDGSAGFLTMSSDFIFVQFGQRKLSERLKQADELKTLVFRSIKNCHKHIHKKSLDDSITARKTHTFKRIKRKIKLHRLKRRQSRTMLLGDGGGGQRKKVPECLPKLSSSFLRSITQATFKTLNLKPKSLLLFLRRRQGFKSLCRHL